eukprot:jgi/Tetstr1/441646/TSEL_029871.t1
MLAASTAFKKGYSSDGGIMRLRKPVCRTAHTTSSRMAPWWQPYPHVPKEAMRSNSCNAGRTGAVTSRAGARLSPSALKGAFRSSNSSRAGSELRAKRKDDEPEAPVEASEDQKESSNKSSRDRKKDDLLQMLEKSGMDSSAAKQVLNVWKDVDALLSAVQELGSGGKTKQLDVVAKAREAINMVKVVQSLNQVSDILKETGHDSKSTLDSLGSYLTLSRAERDGFNPSKFGLSEAEAADIAVKFSKFDLNDDGVLELSEMEKLFSEAEVDLSPEEQQAALKVLDKRSSGTVEFDEFVEWYCNKIPEPVNA